MGPRDLQYFDVLCLAGHDDLLPTVLDIDVIGARSDHGGCVVGLLELGLHAAERDVGFGDFILVVDLEIVAACMEEGVPGPTLWLGLESCFPLSLRNTKAINFIIMSYLIQLTK